MVYRLVIKIMEIIESERNLIKDNNLDSKEINEYSEKLNDYYDMLSLVQYELWNHNEDHATKVIELLVGTDIMKFIHRCRSEIMEIIHNIESIRVNS